VGAHVFFAFTVRLPVGAHGADVRAQRPPRSTGPSADSTQVLRPHIMRSMNLTLSLDKELAERARAVAAGRGKSLNQLVRDLLEAETGMHGGPGRVRALEELWAGSSGRSGGVRIRREEAYEDRLR